MRVTKQRMKKEVWNKGRYYDLAHQASLDVDHPAMGRLSELAGAANYVLDMGCGDGTRLSWLSNIYPIFATGIDLSEEAISRAKRRRANIKWLVSDLESTGLADGSFDLIYSAYVFEHLDNPTRVIQEIKRLLKFNGKFLIVCPNYGAPNRSSPPFKGSRWSKLFRGFWADLISLLIPQRGLSWLAVDPIASSDHYEMDQDTVVEPYLRTFISYCRNFGLEIEWFDSGWSEEMGKARLWQKIFRFFGEMGLYPFKFWGPHFMIIGRKK